MMTNFMMKTMILIPLSVKDIEQVIITMMTDFMMIKTIVLIPLSVKDIEQVTWPARTISIRLAYAG